MKNSKLKYFPVIFCFLLIAGIGKSESRPVDSTSISSSQFKVDILGNIYWTSGNTLFKYSVKNDGKIEYTNTFLGEIDEYDVSNPLKILVYYRTQNQVLFLDKNLAEIASPISLDQAGISKVEAICNSNSGGFWILNPVSRRIEHYDQNLRRNTETSILPELFRDNKTNVQLTEKNNMLYCSIPESSVLAFDLYGNLYKKYPLKNVENIQIINGNIFYFYKGSLNKYSINTLEKSTVDIPEPEKSWDKVKITKDGTFYNLKNQRIFIYK
jgi:hypothetical protein